MDGPEVVSLMLGEDKGIWHVWGLTSLKPGNFNQVYIIRHAQFYPVQFFSPPRGGSRLLTVNLPPTRYKMFLLETMQI